MAGHAKYSEADRRGRNSNQDLTNIGVAGRRTGLRVEGTRRGSDGFENESAFFSPTTTVKKAKAYNDLPSAKGRTSPAKDSGSYEDMDLEASSAQDVTAVLRRRSEGPTSIARRRSKSPTKTHLNSPALRVRGTSRHPPSPPKSILKSPLRPASAGSTVKVARKLDFSRPDPGADSGDEAETGADSASRKRNATEKALKSPSSGLSPGASKRRKTISAAKESDNDEMAEALVSIGIQANNVVHAIEEVIHDNNFDAAYDENYVAQDDVLDEPFDEYIHNEAEADEVDASARASTSKTPSRASKARQSPQPSHADEDEELPEIDLDPPDEVEEDAQTQPQPSPVNEDDEPEVEEEEPTRQPRKRGPGRPKPTKSPARGQAVKKNKVAPRPSFSPSRATRERSVRTASPQREWREPVNHDAQAHEEGDGVRKSSRFKIAPLAFWRGEKLVYGPGPKGTFPGGRLVALPEVKEIIHVDLIEGEQVRRRNRPGRAPGKSKRRHANGQVKEESESESEYDAEHWEEKITVEAPVRSFENQNELVKKVLAIPATAYDPRPVVGQGIFFQKTLSEEPHFAAGVLDIPAGAGKPPKPSKQNTMFFFIFTGYVEVKIHDVVFRLRKGGQFTVPRGNFYEILNIGKTDARLFFSQSTDTLANHMSAHPETVVS